MKEVRIKHYTLVGKKYQVAIGNGITRQFSNKKLCKRFLADTNRFLTDKLHEANFILSDLHVQFRRNWFYFDHHKDPAAALFQMERKCRSNLSSIEDSFDILVDRAGFANGNHYVFGHFRSIFSMMIDTMKFLQGLQRSKSSAVEVHKLEVLFIRVLQLDKEILTYDGTLSKEKMDADEVFTRNRMQAV